MYIMSADSAWVSLSKAPPGCYCLRVTPVGASRRVRGVHSAAFWSGLLQDIVIEEGQLTCHGGSRERGKRRGHVPWEG